MHAPFFDLGAARRLDLATTKVSWANVLFTRQENLRKYEDFALYSLSTVLLSRSSFVAAKEVKRLRTR